MDLSDYVVIDEESERQICERAKGVPCTCDIPHDIAHVYGMRGLKFDLGSFDPTMFPIQQYVKYADCGNERDFFVRIREAYHKANDHQFYARARVPIEFAETRRMLDGKVRRNIYNPHRRLWHAIEGFQFVGDAAPQHVTVTINGTDYRIAAHDGKVSLGWFLICLMYYAQIEFSVDDVPDTSSYETYVTVGLFPAGGVRDLVVAANDRKHTRIRIRDNKYWRIGAGTVVREDWMKLPRRDGEEMFLNSAGFARVDVD